MGNYFEKQSSILYDKANEIINNVSMLKANRKGEKFNLDIPKDFKDEFFALVDKVSLSLMEDKDNFYGYFLFQMNREIRFDISTPTAINFKGAKYVIYFNPIIFLNLNIKQMESTIKHEILHILSMHLFRAKELKNKYSTLAINIAMDITINQYLEYLPPYATTLEWINSKYNLKLDSYETFEYYVDKIQTELDLQEYDEHGEENDNNESDSIKTDYDPEKTHSIWTESDDIDEKTFREFTEKFISQSQKGKVPTYLEDIISSLKNSKAELPWNLYLNRLMGSIESNKKKDHNKKK